MPHGSCVGCKAPLSFNPRYVPSIRVNGVKEPLCEVCAARWNEIHRVSKGLDPIPVDPRAYSPLPEHEL